MCVGGWKGTYYLLGGPGSLGRGEYRHMGVLPSQVASGVLVDDFPRVRDEEGPDSSCSWYPIFIGSSGSVTAAAASREATKAEVPRSMTSMVFSTDRSPSTWLSRSFMCAISAGIVPVGACVCVCARVSALILNYQTCTSTPFKEYWFITHL